MEGGAWQATVHRVSKSRTRLSKFTKPFICPGHIFVSFSHSTHPHTERQTLLLTYMHTPIPICTDK